MFVIMVTIPMNRWETFKGWARWILTREMPKPEREMVDRIIETSKREEAKRMISNVHEVIRRSFEKERSGQIGRTDGRQAGSSGAAAGDGDVGGAGGAGGAVARGGSAKAEDALNKAEQLRQGAPRRSFSLKVLVRAAMIAALCGTGRRHFAEKRQKMKSAF